MCGVFAETKADAHTNDTHTAADMNTFLRLWFAKFEEFQVRALGLLNTLR